MGQWAVRAVIAASMLSIGVTWSRFTSRLYPYSISQPSSYKHVVLTNTAHQKEDYFAPALGSFVTCVVIYAVPGRHVPDEITYLQSLGGRHVGRAGYLTIAGHRYPIIRADFVGVAERWTVEEVVFVHNGRVWRLHLSYAARYRSQRPTMLRMLRSFRFTGTTHRPA